LVRWLRSQRETLQHDKLLGSVAQELKLTTKDGWLVVRCAALDATGNATLLLRCEQPMDPAPMCKLPELTRRENEVLSWLAQGKSNPEIAAILGLSVRTVYKHVENIFPKLGVENRGAAMLRVLSARHS
jgi:DNA-binding CsgD family transcriptional regulator